MNEQVLIKTIQSLSQEIAQLTIDKNLFKSELEQLREEYTQLKTKFEKLQQTNEQEVITC